MHQNTRNRGKTQATSHNLEGSYTQFKVQYFYNLIRTLRFYYSSMASISIILGIALGYYHNVLQYIGNTLIILMLVIGGTLVLKVKSKITLVVWFLTILFITITVYLVEVGSQIVKRESNIQSLGFGGFIGLFLTFSILSRLPWKNILLIFSFYILYFDLAIASHEDQLPKRMGLTLMNIFFIVLLMSVYYRQDSVEYKEFLSLKNYHNRLEFFKRLLQEVIPNEILILSEQSNDHFKEGTQLLYMNDSAQRLFQTDCPKEVLSKLESCGIIDVDKLFNQADIEVNETIMNFNDTFKKNTSTIELNSFKKFQVVLSFIRQTEEAEEFFEGHLTPTSEESTVFELNIGKCEWEDGKPVTILIFNDVSKTQKISKLKSLHRHKDQVLAHVSHSLRTPLNGLVGMIESLNSESISRSEQKKFLELALISAKTMSYLVHDIIDISHLTNGCLKMNFSYESLDDIITQVTELIRFKHTSKGIDFKIINELSIGFRIYCDKTRLLQILLNLLGNAIKFTERGTVIFLIMKTSVSDDNEFRDPQEIQSPCSSKHNEILNKLASSTERITFMVQDTGIGMRPGCAAQIFRLFGQHDRPGNTTGFGLGLAISQQLVLALNPFDGAGIKFQTTFQKGSTFWFSLRTEGFGLVSEKFKTFDLIPSESFTSAVPSDFIIERPKKISSSLPTYSLTKSNNTRVLIVDDDPINILVLINYIKGFGDITYEEASNGKEAVEKVEQLAERGFYFDIVFMDCNMPVMDGYEASRRIRAMIENVKIPTLKIIAVTANATEADEKYCLQNGMDEVLTKPLLKSTFYLKMRKVMR